MSKEKEVKKEKAESISFDDMAMEAMIDLGLPEDEAEMLLNDYNQGY